MPSWNFPQLLKFTERGEDDSLLLDLDKSTATLSRLEKTVVIGTLWNVLQNCGRFLYRYLSIDYCLEIFTSLLNMAERKSM